VRSGRSRAAGVSGDRGLTAFGERRADLEILLVESGENRPVEQTRVARERSASEIWLRPGRSDLATLRGKAQYTVTFVVLKIPSGG